MSRRTSTGIALVAIAALSGCTSAFFDKAVTQFTNGTTASTQTLSSNKAALTDVHREIMTYDYYKPMNDAKWHGSATSGLGVKFVKYVCAASSDLAIDAELKGNEAPLKVLSGISDGVGALDKGPENNDLVTLAVALFHDLSSGSDAKKNDAPAASAAPGASCEKSTEALLVVGPDDLPGFTKNVAGGTPIFPAAMAVAGMADAVVTGLKAVLAPLEAEARADAVRRFVLDSKTQKTVDDAFQHLKVGSTSTLIWCSKSDRSRIFGECSRTEKSDDGKDVHVQVTAFDALTIAQRWAALQQAWYSYYDFSVSGGANVATDDGLLKMRARKKALDAAIASYEAIPSASGVTASAEKAWKNLVKLANGDMTPEQAFEAFAAFATNAEAVFKAASSVNDAKTKLDGILVPTPTSTKGS